MTFVVNKGALIGSTLILMTGATSVHAAPYEVIDLGTLGGNLNFSFGINNLNEVVGSSEGPIIPDDAGEDAIIRTCLVDNTISLREFCNHAYIFRNNTLIDLGELNADSSFLLSINDQSTAVGYAAELLDDDDPETIDPIITRAIISFDGANIEALPFPPEADNLGDGIFQEQRAQYISNDNRIVGYSLVTTARTDDGIATNAFRPYIYDLATETYQLLPLFIDDPALGGGARAINSSGEVVGWAGTELEDGPNTLRALYWDPQNPDLSTDIGTLGGFSSSAWDINDNGYIVGISDTDENFFFNEELAFVYDIDTQEMTQIPEFSEISEYRNAVAYSINNSNQVVGASQVSASFGNLNAAFLWTVGDENLINLNDMIDCDSGWNLVIARDINEAGYITGTGTLDGQVKSFMLVPTADTTPTNCSQPNQQNPDDPVDGGDDSSSGSAGLMSLFILLGAAILRRRKIR